MGVTRAIRCVVGAALVAAGLTLVGPVAARMAAAARAPDQIGPAAVPWAGAPAAPLAPPVVAPATAEPMPAAAGTPAPFDPWAALPAPAGPDSAGGLQLDRHPPPPPAPLPPAPPEMGQTNPALGAAYRSTLRVPPPDLLDAEAPPPAVAWAATTAPAATASAPAPPAAIPTDDVAVPATYRVRDGDDLAGIAGRFYGHPSAASAVWAANRDAIEHPDLLPIGVELRLPPRWAVAGGRQPGAGSIEPAAYSRPSASAGETDRPPAAAGAAWLSPAPPAAHTPAPTPPGPPPRTPLITSVRALPGETLATLARRLYGDPAAAAEIFAVNRDRLRSPDLLVAGTELRLPRPVTAPWP